MTVLVFVSCNLDFTEDIGREVSYQGEYASCANSSFEDSYKTLIDRLFQKYLYEAFLGEWVIYDMVSVSRHLVRRIEDEINDERADIMEIINEKYSYLIGTRIFMDRYTVEIDGKKVNHNELVYHKSINPTDPIILMSYIPTPFEILGPGHSIGVNVIFDFNPNIIAGFQSGFNFFFMDSDTLFLMYDEVIFSLIRYSEI
jgi:hypothetical protein